MKTKKLIKKLFKLNKKYSLIRWSDIDIAILKNKTIGDNSMIKNYLWKLTLHDKNEKEKNKNGRIK